MLNPFNQLHDAINQFSIERDWDKFHSPKNLAMALTVEAAELQECFQWLTEAQSMEPNETQLSAMRDEIADVQIYLIQLAANLNVDIEKACWAKMEKNAEKYPVDLAKGSARKYTNYGDEDL